VAICLVANACVLLSSAGRMNMNTKSSTIIFFGSTSHAVCVMCDSGEEETIDHLFFDCAFAKDCWATIHIDGMCHCLCWTGSLRPGVLIPSPSSQKQH